MTKIQELEKLKLQHHIDNFNKKYPIGCFHIESRKSYTTGKTWIFIGYRKGYSPQLSSGANGLKKIEISYQIRLRGKYFSSKEKLITYCNKFFLLDSNDDFFNQVTHI